MKQPYGYVVKGKETWVCELLKSIYGLKQAPRIWYLVLHAFLQSMGFSRCSKECCLYVKRVGDEWIIIVVYVDDLTIMSRDMSMILETKLELSKRFEMKDLGEISYILKMEVTRDMEKKQMTISQKKYIMDLLKKFGVEDLKVATTPQKKDEKLVAESNMSKEMIAVQPFDYRGLVGSLQYLVRGTRPDIANAVRELSRFLSCYNKSHYEAAIRVLAYLKGTSDYGLLLDGNQQTVSYEVYTDAAFACQQKERKSVSGYIVMMAGTCVSWSSSKQNNVSLSTAESELVALSEGAKESERLYHLLNELGFTLAEPVQVWCDSTAAIETVKNPGNHKSSKHIETRYLFTRDLVEKQRIRVTYCNTKEMVADLLTKALESDQFIKLRNKMGVHKLALE